MRILHANNIRRGRLQSTVKHADALIAMENDHGCETRMFSVDSRDLPDNLFGRFKAFKDGIYARRTLRRFTEVLREFRPDVVHVHEILPLISAWILPRCARLGVPTVMTVSAHRQTCPVATHFRDGDICTRCVGGREHWCVLHNCRGNLAESLAVATHNLVARKFGLFAKHLTRFLAPSEFSRRWLIERGGFGEEQVVTLTLPVAIPPTAADPGAGRYAGYAGRFAPEKGVDVLTEAARATGLPVRMAGDATGLYRDLANVELVLTRGSEELADFYRGARFLVVPSNWYEAFGLVAAEAMAHGVPVVAARVGALPELVPDGVAGLLFEPGDAADLARKMKRLWHDPELCRRLGAAARERVARRCHRDVYMRRLMSIYEESRAALGLPAVRSAWRQGRARSSSAGR